jgi:hypothetical protein
MQTLVAFVRFFIGLLRTDVRFFQAYPIVTGTMLVIALAVAAYAWRYIK